MIKKLVRGLLLILFALQLGLFLTVAVRAFQGTKHREDFRLRALDLVEIPGPRSTYYVRPTGNDAHDGRSPETAWRTVSRVNEVNLAPGDQIWFEGGESFPGSLKLDRRDVGTPNRPIVIGSFGNGRATIEAGEGNGILVHNTGGIRIQDLTIEGDGREVNSGDGIHFLNDLPGGVKISFLRVERVEVSGFGEHGIRVDADRLFPFEVALFGQSGFKDVRIVGAVAHDNAVGGIYVYGEYSATGMVYAHEDVYIGHSHTYRNSGVPGSRQNTGSGIVLSGVDGGTIERSLSHENGWLCDSRQGGPVGIWAWGANAVVIQFNESYGNRTAGRNDGGGFDLDGGVTNSVVQYNYSHDNDGAGYLLAQFAYGHAFTNNVVRYNVSQNDGRRNGKGAITFWSAERHGIRNVDVHNNTVFMAPADEGTPSALDIRPRAARNLRFWNNIFIVEGDLPLLVVTEGQDNLTFEGNVYHSASGPLRIEWEDSVYSDLASWTSVTGHERLRGDGLALNAEPGLADPGSGKLIGRNGDLRNLSQYRLLPASPLVDAGIDPTRFGADPGSQDFFGNSVPQGAGYDVGAHELAQDSDMTGIGRTPQEDERPPSRNRAVERAVERLRQ